MTSINTPDKKLLADFEKASDSLIQLRAELAKAIFGQEDVVELTLAAILGGGHGLLIGAPGLAKTKLTESLGQVLGLNEKRVQFPPDLMPADILGSEVLEEAENGKRAFRFIEGPIFSQLLMADEINRASPRTQSALLQAMQEYQVSVAGSRHNLPRPFHVLATQNPIEQEGTYPLPEAQLDRFLLQIHVPYPDAATERRILLATTGTQETKLKAVLSPTELLNMQSLIRQMPVGEKVVDAILNLVRSARPGNGDRVVDAHVAWGPGPRASQALMLAARARALLRGNLSPTLADVQALAKPALSHRMALSYGARAEGIDLASLIDRLTGDIA